MFFFLPKSASSVSQSQAHLAKRKCNGFNSLTNWTLYGLIPRSLCKIRSNYISAMFNCWELRRIDVQGASHTLSATAATFSGVRTVFDFSRFAILQFLSLFFHKITNIRSWRCFFSSKICTQFSHKFYNITMIFKVMLQYFPALFKLIHNHIRSAKV